MCGCRPHHYKLISETTCQICSPACKSSPLVTSGLEAARFSPSSMPVHAPWPVPFRVPQPSSARPCFASPWFALCYNCQAEGGLELFRCGRLLVYARPHVFSCVITIPSEKGCAFFLSRQIPKHALLRLRRERLHSCTPGLLPVGGSDKSDLCFTCPHPCLPSSPPPLGSEPCTYSPLVLDAITF